MSLYSHGQALTGPEVEALRISRQSAHEGGKVVTPAYSSTLYGAIQYSTTVVCKLFRKTRGFVSYFQGFHYNIFFTMKLVDRFFIILILFTYLYSSPYLFIIDAGFIFDVNQKLKFFF